MTIMTISAIISSLSPDEADLLGVEQFYAGAIAEDTLRQNADAARANPAYLPMLGKLKGNPATSLMWQMAVAAGPAAILSMVGSLVEAGVVSKTDVRKSTGIVAARAEVRWWRAVGEELFHVGHAAIVAEFNRRLVPHDPDADANSCLGENEASLYSLGLPRDVESFDAYLKAMGKASLTTTVDDREDIWTSVSSDGQHKKLTSLSLGYRVDFNVESRNAESAQKAAAEKTEAAAASAASAAAEEDLSDDDSAAEE